MSSTNRGGQRSEADAYPTPAWAVRRLLEFYGEELPTGKWIEPGAGDGAIIRAVNSYADDTQRVHPDWTAVEIRGECEDMLLEVTPNVKIADFIASAESLGSFDVAITNPPFRLAREFIESSMKIADTVIMLLRLNYLSTSKRASFMRMFAPDVCILPDRPSFRGDGSTDSIEYAWMIWKSPWTRSFGTWRVLDSTPASERR